MRATPIRYRDWSLRARLVEKLYRLTHGGRIRTLVITEGGTCKCDHPEIIHYLGHRADIATRHCTNDGCSCTAYRPK
jgi:hypothetical protein